MLAAPQRDHRAEAHEPEEQDAGELLDPDQRMVEPVAPDHPGEQDDDFHEDEERRDELRQPIDEAIDDGENAAARRGLHRRPGIHASARSHESLIHLEPGWSAVE